MKRFSVGDVSFELAEGFIRKVGGEWEPVLERELEFFRGGSGSFGVSDLPEWLMKFDTNTQERIRSVIRNDEGFTWENSAWVEYRDIWVNSDSERYLDKSDGKFYSQESQEVLGTYDPEKLKEIRVEPYNMIEYGSVMEYSIYIEDILVHVDTHPTDWVSKYIFNGKELSEEFLKNAGYKLSCTW